MAEQKPKFRIMKSGYDRFAVDDAVDAYLQRIAMLEAQLETTGRKITQANEQLDAIRQRYQTLVSELTVKEKAADDIARLALKEANTIIQTAQNNADSIVREALSTARLVITDLARVSSEATTMKADMKEQLQALMKTLDEFELPAVPSMEWLQDAENEKR